MALSFDYQTATAGQLAEAVARRDVSALELFEAAVSAIEALDGPINAVVVRDFDRARDSALAADARLAAGEGGALLGVPMTVKESHFVAGLPTTWGLEAFKGWTPEWDATGIARLKAAGAVILGKTNVPPNLGDWQSANPIYGRTHNPHDLTRSAGGSSGGGAAALAAGMVPLEYGSDFGGSIRVPAAFCGVYGHKPSWDLIPATGHAPPGIDRPGPATELAVVGPLARCAADLELALGVLAGPDGLRAKAYRAHLPPPRAHRLSDLRVLVLDNHPTASVDDEVLAGLKRVTDALSAGGAHLTGRSDRLPDLAAQLGLYFSMLMTVTTRGAPGAPPPMDAHAWMNAQSQQFAFQRQWEALFQEVDVVVAPVFGTTAFPHIDAPSFQTTTLKINGQDTPLGAQMGWSTIATLPGLPATAIPAGKTAGGLPVGVQLIGPMLEDLTPITVARLLEGRVG